MIKYLLISIICMPVHAAYLDYESFGREYLDSKPKNMYGDIGAPGTVTYMYVNYWRIEKNPYLTDNKLNVRLKFDITPGLFFGPGTVWSTSYSCHASNGTSRIEKFDEIKIDVGAAGTHTKEYSIELPEMGRVDYECAFDNKINPNLSAWVPDGTSIKDFTIVGSMEYQRGQYSGGATTGEYSSQLRTPYNIVAEWSPTIINLNESAPAEVVLELKNKSELLFPPLHQVSRRVEIMPSGDCSDITVKIGDGSVEPLAVTDLLLHDGSFTRFRFALSGDLKPGHRTCNVNATFIAP